MTKKNPWHTLSQGMESSPRLSRSECFSAMHLAKRIQFNLQSSCVVVDSDRWLYTYVLTLLLEKPWELSTFEYKTLYVTQYKYMLKCQHVTLIFPRI